MAEASNGGWSRWALRVSASTRPAALASGTVSAYATTNSNSSVRIDVTSASGVSALFSAADVNLQGQAVYTVFMLGGNATPTGVIRKER